MRILACLVLAASAAGAAPSVRWIDHLGNLHTQALRAVTAETGRRVELVLADGKPFTLKVFRLFWLVREDERDPEQKALLAARRDVDAGLRLNAARKVLDRIAAKGGQGWMREYAAAARAILAVRSQEKGVLDTLSRFLESYPDSRFYGRILRARACVLAEPESDPEKVVAIYTDTFKRISKAGGPLLARFGTYVDSSLWMQKNRPGDMGVVLQGIEGKLRELAESQEDMAFVEVAQACFAWANLGIEEARAKEEARLGHRPLGERVIVARVARRRWLLPEVRSDAHRLLGRLEAACGDENAARTALEQARTLAPDPRRKELASTLLERLDRGDPILPVKVFAPPCR